MNRFSSSIDCIGHISNTVPTAATAATAATAVPTSMLIATLKATPTANNAMSRLAVMMRLLSVRRSSSVQRVWIRGYETLVYRNVELALMCTALRRHNGLISLPSKCESWQEAFTTDLSGRLMLWFNTENGSTSAIRESECFPS